MSHSFLYVENIFERDMWRHFVLVTISSGYVSVFLCRLRILFYIQRLFALSNTILSSFFRKFQFFWCLYLVNYLELYDEAVSQFVVLDSVYKILRYMNAKKKITSTHKNVRKTATFAQFQHGFSSIKRFIHTSR